MAELTEAARRTIQAVQSYYDASFMPGMVSPDPTVTNTAPTTRVQNSAAALVTVNGTNFATDAVIQVDGVTQTTTRVSATVCTTNYAPGPIGSGSRSFRVRNVAANENSNAVNMTITAT